MNLGDKIKKLRKENNLSQEQLAEKLNVSRQAISKWESNKAYPDIDNLILLRNIFNVNLDDLIIGENTIESECINKSINSPSGKKWYNTKFYKIKEDSEEEEEDDDDEDEEDEIDVNLIIGGFMIGSAIGVITGNFIWASAGSFLGLGIGYILEVIKRKR